MATLYNAIILFCKTMSCLAALITFVGSGWLLWMSFTGIVRRNKSIFSYLHLLGGVGLLVLAMINVVAVNTATDLSWIEMIYIGLAMFLNCFFASSVVDQLPKTNTRVHRVFSFATAVGCQIGIAYMFQWATYRFDEDHNIYLKDKIAIVICQCLLFYGFFVTTLDTIDCLLLACYGNDNPMKLISAEAVKNYEKTIKSGIFRVYLFSIVKVFEDRGAKRRADGEETLTTIRHPVIWLGLIAQMGGVIDFSYLNYIVWMGYACHDRYLHGIMLRQLFLLAVVPNCFAMFFASLVFRGSVKTTRFVMFMLGMWLLLAFANLWTHLIIFEGHEKYGQVSFFFPLTVRCGYL